MAAASRAPCGRGHYDFARHVRPIHQNAMLLAGRCSTPGSMVGVRDGKLGTPADHFGPGRWLLCPTYAQCAYQACTYAYAMLYDASRQKKTAPKDGLKSREETPKKGERQKRLTNMRPAASDSNPAPGDRVSLAQASPHTRCRSRWPFHLVAAPSYRPAARNPALSPVISIPSRRPSRPVSIRPRRFHGCTESAAVCSGRVRQGHSPFA